MDIYIQKNYLENFNNKNPFIELKDLIINSNINLLNDYE